MKQVALDLAAFDDSFLRGLLAPHHRPRFEIHNGVSRSPEGKRRGHRPDSDKISELQSSRGALRALDQRGVPEQDGLVYHREAA